VSNARNCEPLRWLLFRDSILFDIIVFPNLSTHALFAPVITRQLSEIKLLDAASLVGYDERIKNDNLHHRLLSVGGQVNITCARLVRRIPRPLIISRYTLLSL
jgi:hypothetical protein